MASSQEGHSVNESNQRWGWTQAHLWCSSGVWIPGEAAQGSKGLLLPSGPMFVNAVNKNNLAISVNVNSVPRQKQKKKTKTQEQTNNFHYICLDR